MEPIPYRKNKYFMYDSEKEFFFILDKMLNSKYYLFVKVGMNDLLWHPDWSNYFLARQNKIAKKHIDFVICSKNDLAPVLAIELDGTSHDTKKSEKNDKFKDEALHTAGIPLLRIRNSEAHNKQGLLKKLKEHLE